MDAATIVTLVTGAVSMTGGFVGGRRMASGQAVSIAVDTVELLQVQVQSLENKNNIKEAELSELRSRVDLLEGLVTQRAEVEAVHEDVREVREVVDRIAEKVGA
jgi:FtsZ-binding cell division protein ZapB